MAESQVPYLYDGNDANIIKDLSDARFAPYLKSAGFNKQYAFSLYLYNARLSKAFLFPLHILEVTLRNRMSEIFSKEFDDKWFQDKAFRSGLSPESMDALDRGINRAKRPNKEDIVATLTFDFWSNLFRPEYDRFVWQTNMKALLPNASFTRKDFEKVVRNINDFRNRIAHYEPIHKINLSQMHVDIVDTLSWLSTDTSLWVKHYSTVNDCLRMKPNLNDDGHTSVGVRCDNDFQVVSLTDCITEITKSKFSVCTDAQGNISAVIKYEHLARYLMMHLEDGELLLELNKHEFSHLINKLKITANTVSCDAHEPFKSTDKHLKGKAKFLVVMDNHVVKGVIEKSHRRY